VGYKNKCRTGEAQLMARKNVNNICPKCRAAERHPSHGWCRICRNQSTRKHQLKWRYGISPSDKDLMLEKQNFKCAACDQSFDVTDRSCVDHCHNSGTVRGVLCTSCNMSLGLMKENPDLIMKLAEYASRIKEQRASTLSISSFSLEEGRN
jgi:hypothetical protein